MKCNMTDRLGQLPRWAFQDAEAQFEFLVRLAAGGAPQCIALCETDAVVVVSYDHYRSMARSDGSLLEFFDHRRWSERTCNSIASLVMFARSSCEDDARTRRAPR